MNTNLRRAIPIVALVLLALWAFTAHERSVGALRAETAQLRDAALLAKQQRALAGTEFVHDTVTLTRTIDRSGVIADSARALVDRERHVHDSLSARIATISADSAGADSALTYVLAQNDTLRSAVGALAGQRDTLVAAARRVIVAARTAIGAADSLATINQRIAQAVQAQGRCRFCPPRPVVLVAGLALGWYLHGR